MTSLYVESKNVQFIEPEDRMVVYRDWGKWEDADQLSLIT